MILSFSGDLVAKSLSLIELSVEKLTVQIAFWELRVKSWAYSPLLSHSVLRLFLPENWLKNYPKSC